MPSPTVPVPLPFHQDMAVGTGTPRFSCAAPGQAGCGWETDRAGVGLPRDRTAWTGVWEAALPPSAAGIHWDQCPATLFGFS